MPAATQDRNTVCRYVERFLCDDALIAASTTCFNGTLIATNASGELRPAADVAGLAVVGVAPIKLVNASGVAAKAFPPARIRAGVFKFGTTGGSAITAADIGRNCFVLDDQTVVKAAGTTNSIVAGKVEAIDPDGGIWVSVNL
jgi:hypothetical protein